MSNLDSIHITIPEIVNKAWGHEEIVVNDKINGYCGKLLFFDKAGARCSSHMHLIKHEVFRIIMGKFILECVDTSNAKKFNLELNAGDVVKVPRGQPHRIVCLEKGFLAEFSTPDFSDDSYRIEAGDSQI